MREKIQAVPRHRRVFGCCAVLGKVEISKGYNYKEPQLGCKAYTVGSRPRV